MFEASRILVIDDDLTHLDMMVKRLKSLSFSDVSQANSVKQAVDILDVQSPDLVLTDHYLDKGMTSIDFVKTYLLHRNIPVIVMSVFHNEKVFSDILQVMPLDFLSKNCSDFELKKSVELSLLRKEEEQKKSKLQNYFLVKAGNNILKINAEAIEMVEVEGKYLNIYADEKKHIIRSSLNDFVKRLPSQFLKIHQSYIVNMDFVESIDADEQIVKLKHHEAFFSRNYKKTLLNHYYQS
jgi:two-component system LytT family response regulator